MYYAIEGKKFLCVLYVFGLLCGSLLLNLLLRTEYLHYADFLGVFDYITSLEITQLGQFFSYVFMIRMRQMILFFLGICLLSPYVVFCILDVLVSVITGYFVSALVIRSGWMGMFQGLLFYLPHALFYGTFFCIIYAYLFQKNTRLPTYAMVYGHSKSSFRFRSGLEYRIVVIAGCVILFLLGCYTESYWNPRLVKFFVAGI